MTGSGDGRGHDGETNGRAAPALFPAVLIHSLGDARAALAAEQPVTLLSAPGAALSAGCLWWRELVARARAAHPATPAIDVLDCADGAGQAMAALRVGVVRLVLWPGAPGWHSVAAIAAARGGFVLPEAPQVQPPPAQPPPAQPPPAQPSATRPLAPRKRSAGPG
jgi:hypothetical protein